MTTQINTTIGLPSELQEHIVQHFTGPGNGYGQLTTLDRNLTPHTRTVHFHYVKDHSVFALNSHSAADKITHIQKKPMTSGCLWNKEKHIQICWQAKAYCIHKDSEEQDLRHFMWKKIRKEVRLAYFLDKQNIKLDSESIPSFEVEDTISTISTIVFIPHYWDVYLFNSKGHRFGKRYISTYENKMWTTAETSILYTQK